MAKELTFRINGKDVAVKVTAKGATIESLAIHGRRWFQKTYGNTYHSATIEACIGGQWLQIGRTAVHYGYGECYLMSAGEWLIQNGYYECESECFLVSRQIQGALKVSHFAADVARKADL